MNIKQLNYRTHLYIWDGSDWVGLRAEGNDTDLFAENINPATGIGTVTDYEGNVYPTRRWTSTNGQKISGIWMTESLLSIRKADGSYIDCPTGLRLNPAYFGHATAAVVVKGEIPVGTVGDYTNAGTLVSGQSHVAFAKEFGLRYTLSQALDACPKGWHLPTETDWDLLAESMDGIKSGVNYTGIGHAMKTKTNKIFSSIDNYSYNWSHTLTVTENGFNALPGGEVSLGGMEAVGFSYSAHWWSATGNNTRFLYYLNPNFSSFSYDVGYYFSVRCVKD